jgi:hypothetical protein
MKRIVRVEALEGYRLDVRFDDGVRGIVDVSDLAGRGVFALWDDYAEFCKVRIGDTGELVWADRIDLCPDSLCLKVVEKNPEDLFPELRRAMVHA